MDPSEPGLFDVLEGSSSRGAFPLNENNWTNVVAWLLDPRSNTATAPELLTALGTLAGIGTEESAEWTVERETQLADRRRIDIRLVFTDRTRWLIEVKIDPMYQDADQIAAEARSLREGDYLILLAPRGTSDLLGPLAAMIAGNDAIRAVRWVDLANEWQRLQTTTPEGPPLPSLLIEGLARYWGRERGPIFDNMVRTIVEEQGWRLFYPDEFRDVFVARFPDVWDEWVTSRGLTGPSNALQYLTQVLVGMTRRRQGFRLQKTGNQRPPKDPNWGFPVIYEYEVVEG